MTNGASGVGDVCGEVPSGLAHGNAMHNPMDPSVFFVRSEPLKLRGSSCDEKVIGTHSGHAAVVSLNHRNGCRSTPGGGTLMAPPPGTTKFLNTESAREHNQLRQHF